MVSELILRTVTKTKNVKTMLKRYWRLCLQKFSFLSPHLSRYATYITKGFDVSTNDNTKANVARIHIEYELR